MSSIRIAGVLFAIYSHDHLPRHAHASYGGALVIVEFDENNAWVRDHRGAVQPANAKRADVTRILKLALENLVTLNGIWEGVHGKE